MKRLFKIGRSAQVVSFEDKGLGDQEDASKQGKKIDDTDKDAEVTLVDETQGSEKVVEEVVSTTEVSAAAIITTEEITLAQALAELRSAKPKVVVQEPVHVKRGWDTKIPQSSGPLVKVGDEAVHKELGDRMERAATTASNLEAEQYSGSGLRYQDTILGDVDAQTRFGTTSTQSNDPSLLRGYTLGSGEDNLKLLELMKLLLLGLLTTVRHNFFLDLEKAKDAQAKEIATLKKRVQRLERKKKSRTTNASKQGRSIEDIDKDVDVSLVDDTQRRSNDAYMFDIDDLHGDEVNVDMLVGDNQEQSVKEREVDTSVEDSATLTTIEEITLAQTLIQIKAAKPKVVNYACYNNKQ
ncbi:hypothetical protein Tco_1123253 [Tanacetum coccineum]|uniref:Uncharacterized protein n=1 Tax=Tanacetum coccineum TaxID=301880 RepID=A0ABQ5J5D2_9ASTR